MLALRTSCELMQTGNDVTLMCRRKSKLSERALEAGLKVLPLLGPDLSIPSTIYKLVRKFSSEQYEVTHTHLSHDLWTLVPAVRYSRIHPKLFLTKHMGSGVTKKDHFHKFLYDNVTGIFAISNYVKESVLASCPIDESKVYVLPAGISLEKYDKSMYDRNFIKNKYIIPVDSIVVGMAGRMTPGKGHEEFLSAVRLLENTANKNITYLIIGSASYGEESYEEKIRLMAGEYKVQDRLIFTGFIDNIPEILSVLDIFVFPSHEESFGLALLEAMAMELPVIASRKAGVLDIVIDKETGILVPPKDAGSLAVAIKLLAEDQELRCSLGKAGRKRVEMYFRFDDIISRLVKHYSDQV